MKNNIIRSTFSIVMIVLLEIILFLYIIDNGIDLGLYRLIKEQYELHEMNLLYRAVWDCIITFIIFLCVWILYDRLFKKISIIIRLGETRDITRIIKIAVFLIIFGLYTIAGIYYWSTFKRQADIAKMRDILKQEKTVIHACGFIYDDEGNRYDYTNSWDALCNCYEMGNRVVEIDFWETSDNKVVCSHDGLNEKQGQCDEETFLAHPYNGIFKTMGLKQLSEFMKLHDDIFVVTDVKTNNYVVCKQIADNYPELVNRFIVQIYHIEEYDSIRQLGYNNIIYTLYRTDEQDRVPEHLVNDIKHKDLVGLTFWEGWMKKVFFEAVQEQTDIPLFVHTVNDAESIKYDLEQGVMIYTDNVDNAWLR